MFPDEQLSELKDRISQMSNEELLRIVEVEFDDYREEALQLAEAELGKRSIPFERPAPSTTEAEDTDSNVPAEANAPCGNCGGEVRSGLLFADREMSILFSDNNEERFVKALACKSCGDVRLVVDLETEVEG
jgi:hypothetical protein